MWNNLAAEICGYVEKNDVDMIALIHYEHTFMEKLTREPVVRKIGFHTKRPILVLPEIQ